MEIERIIKSYEQEVVVDMKVVRIRTTISARLTEEERRKASEGSPGAKQFISEASQKLYLLARAETERNVAKEKEKK